MKLHKKRMYAKCLNNTRNQIYLNKRKKNLNRSLHISAKREKPPTNDFITFIMTKP